MNKKLNQAAEDSDSQISIISKRKESSKSSENNNSSSSKNSYIERFTPELIKTICFKVKIGLNLNKSHSNNLRFEKKRFFFKVKRNRTSQLSLNKKINQSMDKKSHLKKSNSCESDSLYNTEDHFRDCTASTISDVTQNPSLITISPNQDDQHANKIFIEDNKLFNTTENLMEDAETVDDEKFYSVIKSEIEEKEVSNFDGNNKNNNELNDILKKDNSKLTSELFSRVADEEIRIEKKRSEKTFNLIAEMKRKTNPYSKVERGKSVSIVSGMSKEENSPLRHESSSAVIASKLQEYSRNESLNQTDDSLLEKKNLQESLDVSQRILSADHSKNESKSSRTKLNSNLFIYEPQIKSYISNDSDNSQQSNQQKLLNKTQIANKSNLQQEFYDDDNVFGRSSSDDNQEEITFPKNIRYLSTKTKNDSISPNDSYALNRDFTNKDTMSANLGFSGFTFSKSPNYEDNEFENQNSPSINQSTDPDQLNISTSAKNSPIMFSIKGKTQTSSTPKHETQLHSIVNIYDEKENSKNQKNLFSNKKYDLKGLDKSSRLVQTQLSPQASPIKKDIPFDLVKEFKQLESTSSFYEENISSLNKEKVYEPSAQSQTNKISPITPTKLNQETSNRLVDDDAEKLDFRSHGFGSITSLKKDVSNQNPNTPQVKPQNESVLITKNDSDENQTKKPRKSTNDNESNKDIEPEDDDDKSSKDSSIFKSDNKISTNDIKIKMKVVKPYQKHETGFYLYENQNKRKYKSKRMPNVCFNVNRDYHDKDDTQVQIKIYEISNSNNGLFTSEDEKIVGNFNLNLRPDQRMKEFEFYDDFKNKICLKLKRNKK